MQSGDCVHKERKLDHGEQEKEMRNEASGKHTARRVEPEKGEEVFPNRMQMIKKNLRRQIWISILE